MNNEIILPIDLTQEEKEVLAIFSMRQFMLVFPVAVGGLAFFIWGGFPFITGLVEIIIKLFVILILGGAAGSLAFVKLEKYEQYLSQYVITLISYRFSQKTYHS